MRRRQGSWARWTVAGLLAAVTPLSMGGCTNEFQDSVVGALETAAHSIADAAVTQFFSSFTSN